MNDEAPERVWFHPKTRALSESHCGCGSEIEFRRVDPPVVPKCPTCKSDDKDIRNLGCNGSYGILHDNCGTEPCPDAWHAPAALEERDKALVDGVLRAQCRHAALLDSEEFIINEANLRKALFDVLATVRAEAVRGFRSRAVEFCKAKVAESEVIAMKTTGIERDSFLSRVVTLKEIKTALEKLK